MYKKVWRKQPRSNPAVSSGRRFNVTVVTSGPSDEGFAPPISPGPRHRGEQFASIPEDHVLEEPVHKHLSDSRSGSPAPSWDFSNDSDSVGSHQLFETVAPPACARTMFGCIVAV
ncbi:hypothetical protein QE152_g19723 [Popillia japonica]|uniref:Uncharacterized protein n=1 Tax=Popillia japonica TaxID=7064 RepID=A0AAW1KQC0_POPJA